jgi:aromatic-L-amino-acid decarboxylase
MRRIVAAVGPLSLPPDELRRLGHHVWDRLVDRWETLDASPPIAPEDPDWHPGQVAPCPHGPTDPQAAIDALFDVVLPRGQRADHPRFFARIGSPSNPLSVLADLIGAGHNTFVGSWTGGAGAAALELAVLDWLREWMGMPAHGADRAVATAYAQEHTHAAIARAWRVLGFAPEHLRILAPDAQHRLTGDAVEEALRRDRAAGLKPLCIAATAGTTSSGAVDHLGELAALAERERLWFHVDGAYGAPARLVDQPLLAGIEHADSLVLDPHKWLFQPYEVGCVLVRRPGALERAFALGDGAYLRDTGRGLVEFRDRGPQLTRGSRALKLWLSLRVFGLDAFKAAIARGIALAEYAQALLDNNGWEIVSPAQLAIVCFRPPRASDEETTALVQAAVADGFAAPSTTVLHGRVAARLCTINPRTSERDIERTVARLTQLAR